VELAVPLDARLVAAPRVRLRCLLHPEAHPRAAVAEEIPAEWLAPGDARREWQNTLTLDVTEQVLVPPGRVGRVDSSG